MMLAFLLAAPIAAAALAPGTRVTLAPPEEAEATFRCDPRPCLKPQPKPATAYEGTFALRIEPQMQCRQAPCPRAGTIVTLPDGATVRVGRFAYAQGTAKVLKLDFDPMRRTILFEGKLWITLRDEVAILAPVSARYAPEAANGSPSHPPR